MSSPAPALRAAMERRDVIPFIGVYDVFSATLAARRFDALFVSGFGLGASLHGLPDRGFITWTDVVAFVGRVRTVLPTHHLLVDVDDGYGDAAVAGHVAAVLESTGASGIVLEDQRRPRRCGHYEGKQLLELEEFLPKLAAVLAARRGLVVVARTDAEEPAEQRRRAGAFAEAGADAVLVDGVSDLQVLRELSATLPCRIMFNQIAGGRSPRLGLRELRDVGVSLVNYSTPCLFAAQGAVETALDALARDDGRLPDPSAGVTLVECTRVLDENLAGRDRPRE